MGSGVSTEPATNIEIKELATRNVISGYHIRYDFPENVTCITHIEYDSKRTFRKTTAIVEVLNNKSALVPKLPAGRIYKHVNIWVGENAAGLPTSLKNGLVGFRVEKKWIENNNVSESLVTLQWYNKGWKPLDTEKIGEDENYIYFKSKTPGYSFFAITEYSAEDKDKEETQLQKTLRSLSGQNGIDEKPMKAAKILIAFSLPLFALLVGYAVLKKKI
ncbi:PGF-pre-PGF domain-containing protein [Methanosarcina sp. DH2]|uniref:PGF-pre-PGF domain-containing protein n=1 Tax=Methanosarcina sp. DH2 TaxID=2605639 RepID=UPI0031F6EF1F|nr:PGF-pre-PGF domain-containing protein [Methanosarcina sp. DH2]